MNKIHEINPNVITGDINENIFDEKNWINTLMVNFGYRIWRTPATTDSYRQLDIVCHKDMKEIRCNILETMFSFHKPILIKVNRSDVFNELV